EIRVNSSGFVISRTPATPCASRVGSLLSWLGMGSVSACISNTWRHDHSMYPTSERHTATRPMQITLLTACENSHVYGRGGRRLVVLPHVFPHLVMPVGPLVTALRAPVVQMMSNAAVPEDLGHAVARPAVLPRSTAGHEPDVATRVVMKIPCVTQVRHVVHRVIEIEVVVIHPVHRIPHVVDA